MANSTEQSKQTPGCLPGCLVGIIAIFVLAFIGAWISSCGKATPKELSKIEAWTEVQNMTTTDGKHKVVVWVKNNADKPFTGTVVVKSYDVDDIVLGRETFYPENLKPGLRTYGVAYLKIAPVPDVRVEVVEGRFK